MKNLLAIKLILRFSGCLVTFPSKGFRSRAQLFTSRSVEKYLVYLALMSTITWRVQAIEGKAQQPGSRIAKGFCFFWDLGFFLNIRDNPPKGFLTN